MTDTDNLPAVAEEARHVPAGAEESSLVLWAYEARQANQIAQALARTAFVPASMQGKPHDITAAILAGRELGLDPMASLRSMDIIGGNVFLRAHAMRGLVLSHGHRIWVKDASPTEVTVCGQRRETALTFGAIQEVTWTIDRATAMGLANKAEWRKQPLVMLTARATAELCRLIAADVLFAMPYAIEEYDPSFAVEADAAPALSMADLTEGDEELPPRPLPKPKRAKPKDVPTEPITDGPLVDQPLFDDDGNWPPTAEVAP